MPGASGVVHRASCVPLETSHLRRADSARAARGTVSSLLLRRLLSRLLVTSFSVSVISAPSRQARLSGSGQTGNH
jgi:hypothetical protein